MFPNTKNVETDQGLKQHTLAATTFPFRRPAWKFLGPLSCTGDGPVALNGKVAKEIIDQNTQEKGNKNIKQ